MANAQVKVENEISLKKDQDSCSKNRGFLKGIHETNNGFYIKASEGSESVVALNESREKKFVSNRSTTSSQKVKSP